MAALDSPLLSPWVSVVCTAIATLIGYGLYTGYRVRSHVNQLRKAGLPMPEWSWAFGHLPILQKYLSKYPSDTFINVLIIEMVREFPDAEMFYLDLWPFLKPNICICNPEAAFHVTNKLNLPKPEMYRTMFDPMMGGPNILTANGKEWKYWRALFNPGFAPAYLIDQVPAIVDSVEVFCEQLGKKMGDVFCFEEVGTRLTMDIIMKVALDIDLNYQLAPHPLADALRTMISWTSFGNPLNSYHPIRKFVLRYYGSVMDRLIEAELEHRFEEHKTTGKKASKSVATLALDSYLADKQDASTTPQHLDKTFLKHATYQLRLFLFAGHDTTTSVLVYTYHMLHKHPSALARMQEEHALIIGPPATTSSRLREAPALLNKLTYTAAVIKETMRLYPPAGAYRDGSPAVTLTAPNGLQFPTAGCLISLVHHAIHYNPRVWPRVQDFVPERWLVGEGHELYPPAGAFRAFEQGPRACIGQNLSLLEVKVALAMTVRRFKISPAYEEWDQRESRGVVDGVLRRVGLGNAGPMMVDGDRAYQIEKGGAHPKDGYPCRVELLGA
ncbi:hypothetical protein N0V90_000516 [Kalmusia sp. IMI 367209]|nr:hypothetical protein N0V90_000516 [Kalmusia sp. IMI 367209]